MSVNEIESAIRQLTPADLGKFAVWFDEYYSDQWDRQIEQDARAGRLDALAQSARDQFTAGECRPL